MHDARIARGSSFPGTDAASHREHAISRLMESKRKLIANGSSSNNNGDGDATFSHPSTFFAGELATIRASERASCEVADTATRRARCRAGATAWV